MTPMLAMVHVLVTKIQTKQGTLVGRLFMLVSIKNKGKTSMTLPLVISKMAPLLRIDQTSINLELYPDKLKPLLK